MFFTTPLTPGTLIRRYKRFLADIELSDGQTVTAHCANTGSMTGLAEPGMKVLLSPANNPKRKLAYTWEMSFAESTWVGVNTGLTNYLVREALQGKKIPQLASFDNIRSEVPFGKSTRLDFLLTDNRNSRCFIEVKSVTLRCGEHLAFPDAVTKRGTRHLQSLMDVVAQGDRAVLFFLAQRSDGCCFKPAAHIDPTYAKTLIEAINCGVEVMAWQCITGDSQITVNSPLSMELS
ncbi:MAG: DNA/RNA nuclease SfsA [Magnetococcales bacterium]|nr:DNA/RNA nuclease SfsA [Magnetococcales bacterium]